ncbi:hypothetical protein EVAR_19815_1 [Eumeta japonica]|uniref:Mariner Mos1 transposase n=1 Tax=Eumeta variegata TaxID=151549 RepID=A0A4C1UQM3_EUMVA|nr:hypothetical protein EVAR_19815_1 [Eumeta japonica]
MKNLIQDNQRIAYEEIQRILQIESRRVHDILNGNLCLRSTCSRWVVQNLKQAQKQVLIVWYSDKIVKFKAGCSRCDQDNIPGDESLIYQCDPETMRPSSVKLSKKHKRDFNSKILSLVYLVSETHMK